MTNVLRIATRRRHSARTRSRHDGRLGRFVCRQHGAPLLAMASLILQDADAACEIVVDTIAAACNKGLVDPRRRRARVALATSVYRRCLAALVVRERFGAPPVPEAGDGFTTPAAALAGLTIHQRCAMALTIFGGHSLDRTGRTLGLSTEGVLRELRDLLAILTVAAATPRATPIVLCGQR